MSLCSSLGSRRQSAAEAPATTATTTSEVCASLLLTSLNQTVVCCVGWLVRSLVGSVFSLPSTATAPSPFALPCLIVISPLRQLEHSCLLVVVWRLLSPLLSFLSFPFRPPTLSLSLSLTTYPRLYFAISLLPFFLFFYHPFWW